MTSVLVVSHTAALWGAQLRLRELAPLLGERGFDLTLAAPGDGPLVEAWRACGLRTVRLDVPAHRGLRREDGERRPPPSAILRELGVVWRSAARIARLARRSDLVQSHSLSAHFEVALAGRLARRPTVLDVHDIVEPGLGRTVLRTACRLATATIANSRATAEMLDGVPSRRLNVVHPGVDTERFRPGPVEGALRKELGGAPDVPLVGILGRVDPLKRIGLLVEAMAGLEGEAARARLVVVGDTHRAPAGYAEELQDQATRLLGERARFVGARGDVPDVLRALDIVVSTSRVESFGRAILEAQATALPVVAPAVGGIVDLVQDGVTGLLVPPAQVEPLRSALDRLLRDRTLRERLGEAALRQATQRFGLPAQRDKVADVYGDALGRFSPS